MQVLTQIDTPSGTRRALLTYGGVYATIKKNSLDERMRGVGIVKAGETKEEVL